MRTRIAGRVDVLLSRLIETAVEKADGPILPLLYEGAKPGLDLLITEHVGPRTKRGRQISRTLLEARDAYERVQAKRLKMAGRRV